MFFTQLVYLEKTAVSIGKYKEGDMFHARSRCIPITSCIYAVCSLTACLLQHSSVVHF